VIGVPLFSSAQEYMELNVLAADGQSIGIIKKYTLEKDKRTQLNIYDGTGKLIISGPYDPQKRLLISSHYSAGMKLLQEKDFVPAGSLHRRTLH
jgi:hypothetical protein